MKKKVLRDVFIFICILLCLFLTGCDKIKEEEKKPIVKKVQNIEYYEIEEKEVSLTEDTTQWPSGVYDAYSIPKYTAGKVSFAKPNDKNGEVYIKTTVKEFRTYINKLIDAGFRMNSEHLNRINKENNLSITTKLYSPNIGDGYILHVVYTNKDGGKGVDAFVGKDVMVGINQDYEFFYNLSIKIEPKAYSKKLIQDDLLSFYGISNEALTPKFEFATITREVPDDINVLIHYDVGFDRALTEEEIEEYKKQVIKEVEKIADENKIYDYNNEVVVVDEFIESGFSEFNYNFKGKNFSLLFEMIPEIGEPCMITLIKNNNY